MKQAASYRITQSVYDKGTQEFSYLEINGEKVPLAGDVILEANKEVTVNTSGTTEVTPTSGKDAMKKVTITSVFKLYAFKSSGGAIAYLPGSATPGDTGKAYLATEDGLSEVDYTKTSDTVISIEISEEATSFTRYSDGDFEF